MDIIEMFNQDRETTIQFDISELLHFNFSTSTMQKLKCRNDYDVKKLLSLFPLSPNTKNRKLRNVLTI